jgi:hypothetical protein
MPVRRFAYVRMTVAMTVLLASALARGQQGTLRGDPALEPLLQGEVVVWLVSHGGASPARTNGLTAESHEETAGDFGRESSTFGQTAGDTGQTAGSFGVSDSELAGAIAAAHAAGVPDATGRIKRDLALWMFLARDSPPGASVRYVDVGDGELKERLEAAARERSLPDVIVGYPLPAAWYGGERRLADRYGVAMVGPEAEGRGSAQTRGGDWAWPDVAILRGAPHPAAARAYALWLMDSGLCRGCVRITTRADDAARTSEPVETAERVLRAVLTGQPPGNDADLEMAPFEARDITGNSSRLANPVELRRWQDRTIRVDVMAVQGGKALAVVELRAIASSSTEFGVYHALAVLRPDTAGRWRVLHLTPQMSRSVANLQTMPLLNYAGNGTAHEASTVGVTLASPPNGDDRMPKPELWWDNAGGATMQVVEWQRCDPRCSVPELQLVPDADVRLHTRVIAGFAEKPARYRWRVWSMARGGTLVLSPWRSFSVISK